jgi:D-3-phosphoglycerate dehydrogenase
MLLAGDRFIRNDLLEEAILDQPGVTPTFERIELPWPQVPYGAVAEVDEASGSEDAVVAAIGEAEVVVTQMAPLTARVLASAPKLRLIVCTRGGPVNINLEAATKGRVAVSCTPGRNAVAAAEYALLLMMAAMRRLPQVHNETMAGRWRSDLYDYDECGREVAGSTVGVVGLGEIGRRLAGMLAAMGATVIAHDPYLDQAPDGIELVGLDALLERSDAITLHARLTSESRGMIGPAELARLRPDAVLVNTARGGLLDYDAALAALDAGSLGALALDVYAKEPIPAGSPLLTHDRVVVSPHLAGATRPTAHRAIAIAAAEVGRHLRGEAMLHVVNGVDGVDGVDGRRPSGAGGQAAARSPE